MLRIVDATTTPAPPEEVWKLLYDPSRFASWWYGVEDAQPDGDGRLVVRAADDSVMPQRLETDRGAGRVTVSCLVLGLEFEWSLAPLDGGGTRIAARIGVPEREAARAGPQREAIAASLRRLAELAARGAPRARG